MDHRRNWKGVVFNWISRVFPDLICVSFFRHIGALLRGSVLRALCFLLHISGFLTAFSLIRNTMQAYQNGYTPSQSMHARFW